MQEYYKPITLTDVLEYDGLIESERGELHITIRFRRKLSTSGRGAARPGRVQHSDLHETITRAMHRLYGKCLSEAEMASLVEAMLPIAAREER